MSEQQFPHFSVLVISHRKPVLVRQCVNSVLTQTYPYFDLTIVDSGDLLPMLKTLYGFLPHVSIVPTKEPEDLGKKVVPVSWVLNNFLPKLKGPWYVWISDDDVCFPTYLEAMASEIIKHPEKHAFYCGEVRVVCNQRGWLQRVKGVWEALDLLRPKFADCQVDGLQFIHDRHLLDKLLAEYKDKPWPEELEESRHIDGIFMERALEFEWAQPVPGIHCMNRRTPESAFCGAE